MSSPTQNDDRITTMIQEIWPRLAKYLSETEMLNLNEAIPYAHKWQVYWHFSRKDLVSELLRDLMKDPEFQIDPSTKESVAGLLSRALLYPDHVEHQKEALLDRIKATVQNPNYKAPYAIAHRKRQLEDRCYQEGLQNLMVMSTHCKEYVEGKGCVGSLEECVAELILENELMRYGDHVYDMRFRSYRDMLNDLVFEGSRLEDSDYNIYPIDSRNQLHHHNGHHRNSHQDNDIWTSLNEGFFMLSVDPHNQPTKERWITAAILLVSSEPFNADCSALALQNDANWHGDYSDLLLGSEYAAQDEYESQYEETVDEDPTETDTYDDKTNNTFIVGSYSSAFSYSDYFI